MVVRLTQMEPSRSRTDRPVGWRGRGLQPLFVATVSWLFTGRRRRTLDLAVRVVAALGVGLVVIRPGAGLDPIGLLAAVGANVSFAVGVVTKQLPAGGDGLATADGRRDPRAARPHRRGHATVADRPHIAGFAYLSLVGTALAFVLWFIAIHRLPAAAAAHLAAIAYGASPASHEVAGVQR